MVGYNPQTQVTRVVDQGEPSEFKSLFKNWREKEQTVGLGKKFVSEYQDLTDKLESIL